MRDPKAEAEIERIERLFGRTDFDLDECISYIDPDSFVGFDLMPPTLIGRKGYEAHLRMLLATLPKYRIELLRLEVHAGSDYGFANSLQHLDVYDDAGNVTFAADTRVTVCYRKSSTGRWMQVAQHASVPVDLSTGKPIFDIKW
jgi:ketosteroid isomerase-like protein